MKKMRSYLKDYSLSYQKTILRKYAKENELDFKDVLNSLKSNKRLAQRYYKEYKKDKQQSSLSIEKKYTTILKNTLNQKRNLENHLPKDKFDNYDLIFRDESEIKAIFKLKKVKGERKGGLSEFRKFLKEMEYQSSKGYIKDTQDKEFLMYEKILEDLGENTSALYLIKDLGFWEEFLKSKYFQKFNTYPSDSKELLKKMIVNGISPISQRIEDFLDEKGIDNYETNYVITRKRKDVYSGKTIKFKHSLYRQDYAKPKALKKSRKSRKG